MGLLDRWDRRNQDTLEFHNEVERRERAGNPIFKPVTAGVLLALWVGSWMLRSVLVAAFGGAVAIGVLAGIAGILLVVLVVQARGARRKWDAGEL
ncbi:hypothetical protein PO878_08815 [Iamia majanohamensis]|uniref:Uncharacterized protein n=1 Tax=Iamia majanohamensis TaxID=467976 RepID=A0AAE9Y8I0_9ACTN|nr:hypothetical protein [Iamia majanohamensis]WCO68824.1 hypothetical protein PO878_08815 [Iamia majanohamensis]